VVAVAVAVVMRREEEEDEVGGSVETRRKEEEEEEEEEDEVGWGESGGFLFYLFIFNKKIWLKIWGRRTNFNF
jgi:ribosomal protein L12E/L44/L45/RPP1/RPP2